MDYGRNVINDNSGVYLKYEYLMFPVSLNIVPKIVVGSDVFFSKINYHISLLCLERIPKQIQKDILAIAKRHDLKIGRKMKTFRLATEGDQKTIIVRARIYGLKKLVLEVNNKLGYYFKYPPTHITLLTLKGQTGIGIDTYKKYRQICSQVSPSEISRLEKSFEII